MGPGSAAHREDALRRVRAREQNPTSHSSLIADIPSRPRGAFRPSFALSLRPLIQEGAGKAGCQLAPAVRCAKSTRRKTAQQHTGVANHSAFPAQWLYGLCRALPGAEFVLASLASRRLAKASPVEPASASAKA